MKTKLPTDLCQCLARRERHRPDRYGSGSGSVYCLETGCLHFRRLRLTREVVIERRQHARLEFWAYLKSGDKKELVGKFPSFAQALAKAQILQLNLLRLNRASRNREEW